MKLTPARFFADLQPRAANTRACALATAATAELCGLSPPLALPYWLGIAGWMGHVLTCEADTQNSSGCATIRTACRGGASHLHGTMSRECTKKRSIQFTRKKKRSTLVLLGGALASSPYHPRRGPLHERERSSTRDENRTRSTRRIAAPCCARSNGHEEAPVSPGPRVRVRGPTPVACNRASRRWPRPALGTFAPSCK